MNLSHATTCIDAATAILREDNDRAEMMDYWRKEILRLQQVADGKIGGTADMLTANYRLSNAKLALLRLTMQEAESARLRAEESTRRPL